MIGAGPMTANAAQFDPRTRPSDRLVARFGLLGNLVMMVFFIIGLPLAAVIALIAGVACTLSEWVWRPFSPARRAAKRATRRWLDGAARRAPRGAGLDVLADLLSERLTDPDAPTTLELSRRSDRVIISFPAAEAFENAKGQARLSATGCAAVKALGAFLRVADYRIDVIGYTPGAADADPSLVSRARAIALADALKKTGCARHVAVFGAGESPSHAPAATGADVILRHHSESGRRAA